MFARPHFLNKKTPPPDLTNIDAKHLHAVASTTGPAEVNIAPGVAPTSPANGDIWTTTTGFFVRIGGATKDLFNLVFALTYFTEARSVAAPNATVPAHSLSATGAETNIDLVLVPKGNGALITGIPDNTSTGGNKRGTQAVDLQLKRNLGASQVAAGVNSGLLSGANNRIGTAQQGCVIAGGEQNDITSVGTCKYAFLGGGNQNAIQGGQFNVLCGGELNSVTGDHQGIVAGKQGGFGGVGWNMHGAGSPSGNVGDAQAIVFPVRQTTTDATQKALGFDAGRLNNIFLSTAQQYAITGEVVAQTAAGVDRKAWKFEAVVSRPTAGATAVDYVLVTVLFNTAGAAAWALNFIVDPISANNTALHATGVAATTIQWAGTIRATQMRFS